MRNGFVEFKLFYKWIPTPWWEKNHSLLTNFSSDIKLISALWLIVGTWRKKWSLKVLISEEVQVGAQVTENIKMVS